jgi:hypothetical protein
MARLFILLAALSTILPAQGTKPKASPAEYPAHSDLKGVTIAAENLGHSIMSDYGACFARDYLVIEVAVFSAQKKRQLSFSAGNFSLRLNGKTTPLLAQAPGLVAGSIKYDDWSQRPQLVGSAGVGDTGVTVGGPRQTGRFPGDPNGTSRVPAPPSVNTSDPNVPPRQDMPVDEAVRRMSLPEGTNLVAPLSGFLYFPFKGKLNKLKSVELLYQGDYGEADLLLP